jgi:hypothetical protein
MQHHSQQGRDLVWEMNLFSLSLKYHLWFSCSELRKEAHIIHLTYGW